MSESIDEDSAQQQDPQYSAAHDRPAEQPERATRGLRLRGKRVAMAVTLAVATLIVVVVAAMSGSVHVQPESAGVTAEARQIDALLAGIPEAGNALGSPKASVTLQFFGDLECPTSRTFTLLDLPSLISRWVRTGHLRIEYRSLETATHKPAVFIDQQAAALAAGMQAKGWYYIELFYHEQGREDTGYVTTTYLDRLADQVPGLDVGLWRKDRQEPPLAARVASDEQTAARLGLHSTPALLIARTGSSHPSDVPPFLLREPTTLYQAIENALTGAQHLHTAATTPSATTGRHSSVDWTGGPRAAHDPGSTQC
jgi:protein-disulfide isomerase